MTLNRVGVDDSLITPNEMMIRAFHGIKTWAYGEIDLKMITGPYEFELPFVVVDSLQSLTCFKTSLDSLAGAIWSNLHQNVKFISGKKLITIMAEEDIHVPTFTMVPFIDTQLVKPTSKYYSFELMIVN